MFTVVLALALVVIIKTFVCGQTLYLIGCRHNSDQLALALCLFFCTVYNNELAFNCITFWKVAMQCVDCMLVTFHIPVA